MGKHSSLLSLTVGDEEKTFYGFERQLTGRQHLGANNDPPTSLSSDTSESDGK